MSKITQNRKFMHCPSFFEGMAESDQSKEVAPPPFNKTMNGAPIVLPAYEGTLPHSDYATLLDTRRSLRSYADKPMTQEELSFMLWSAQGIQYTRAQSSFRPTPSGGARHPFETYIWVRAVEGLKAGLYHYTPQVNIGDKKCTITFVDPMHDCDLTAMLAGQKWAEKAPIILFYTCVPYRAEWRYVEMAHRVMLIDLGHLGQNVMLSAAALGMGSCCMAAYNQTLCDEALSVDGINEYTVYAVTVGTAAEVVK